MARASASSISTQRVSTRWWPRSRRTAPKSGGQALDVADRAGMAAAFDAVAERHGRIDVVFANAGIDAGPGFLSTEGHRFPEGAIDVLDDHHWDRVIEVNLTSVYTTVKHAARHMKRPAADASSSPLRSPRRSTRRSSARLTCPPRPASTICVRQMAMELGVFGILINCISPGPFLTNIAGGRLKRVPSDRRAFEAQSLIGKIGDPDDIKGLALYLASPCSSYVTGSQMVIDGGSMHRIK